MDGAVAWASSSSPARDILASMGMVRRLAAVIAMTLACSDSSTHHAPPDGGTDGGEPERENCAMMGPCADSLEDCPPSGCDAPDSARGRLSIEKRTLPESVADPLPVTHDILIRLQELTDDIVGTEELYYPTPEEWDQLSALDVDGLVLGQGDVVALAGWLVGHFENPMGPEPVNCCVEDAAVRDWHLPLVAERPAVEPNVDSLQYASIITEVIPQYHLPGWSLDVVRGLSQAKTKVKVVGRLMYDSPHRPHTHLVPDENAHPRRVSSWEVHPVVEIWQCPEGLDCQVDSTVGWEPVE